MTSRTRRPKRNTGKLKVLLFSSSMAATLAGTQVLNTKYALQPSSAAATNEETAIMVRPAANATTIRLPPPRPGTQIVLKQIPQVVQPQFRPIARSRSSS